MAEPVDDMPFAGIAPHYAERAAVETAGYAEFGREAGDAIADTLNAVAQFRVNKRDPRKHTDECFTSHADCLANKIADILGFTE